MGSTKKVLRHINNELQRVDPSAPPISLAKDIKQWEEVTFFKKQSPLPKEMRTVLSLQKILKWLESQESNSLSYEQTKEERRKSRFYMAKYQEVGLSPDKAYKLYQKGTSIAAIARLYGISRQAVAVKVANYREMATK